MVQAIAEAVEIVEEVAASIEECKMTAEMINDIQSVLSEIKESASGADMASGAGLQENVFSETLGAKLEPNSTYFKDGHRFETDEKGMVSQKDGENISKGESSNIERIENEERKFYSTEEERLGQTPKDGERGTWTGERGESIYKPNITDEKGKIVAEKLSEYGLDGISYEEKVPNFDQCAEESVEIDMTDNRQINFRKADDNCAQKWNAMKKDGRTDWIGRDVEQYRSNNKMTWHECPDRKTCQMIKMDIHEFYGHTGGIFECRKFKEMTDRFVGGVFDE